MLTNYVETIIDFSKIITPEMRRCLEYIKKEGLDPESMFPPIRHKVSFELHDTTVEMANTIRKCILDELTIKSMTFDVNDWTSDDRYILSDFLKTNLEHIPISQDKNYDDVTIYLYKVNDTNHIINIYSHDLVVEKKQKLEKSQDYFASNVALVSLQPGKYLKISNIQIVEGHTYENAGKFAAVASTEYEILEQIPTKFRLSYTTFGNFTNPRRILDMCFETLQTRLKSILDELKLVNIEKPDISYFSDKLKIEQREDILYIYINDESWSIGRLIAKYGYLEDPHIPFITSGIIHPSINKCYIKIKHSQPIKLLISAMETLGDSLGDSFSLKKSLQPVSSGLDS